MSTLKVNKLRDTAGSADAITLDPNGGAVLAGVTTMTTARVTSGIVTNTFIVGAGVTISESGIEASGIGITCANINGAQIGGRRNLFINGAMQIAQRATSSTSGGYVSLDRWYVNLSGGSATFSQETNSNPSETGGIQKYARYNVSTSSDYTHIRQRIEDVTSVPAGTVIISFYAKGTAPSGGLYVSTEQNFGSGGSSSVDGTAVLVTSSLTSSWVRYTAQITIGSVDGKTIGTGNYIGIAIGQHSNTGGTAYDLNITGVQLEVGSQATAFEHRSHGEEIRLCERYFCKSYDIGTAPATATFVGAIHGRNYDGTGRSANPVFVYFVSRMRAQPTMTFYAGDGQSNKFSTGSTVGGTDLTTESTFGTSFINSESGIFHCDLAASVPALNLFAFQYTADAEL